MAKRQLDPDMLMAMMMGREMGLEQFPLTDPGAMVHVPGKGTTGGRYVFPGNIPERPSVSAGSQLARAGKPTDWIPGKESGGPLALYKAAPDAAPAAASKWGKFGKWAARIGGPLAGLMVVNEVIQSAREAKQKSWADGVSMVQNMSRAIDTDAMSADYMADQMSLAATVAEGKAALSDSSEYAHMIANNMPLLQMLSVPPSPSRASLVSSTASL